MDTVFFSMTSLEIHEHCDRESLIFHKQQSNGN